MDISNSSDRKKIFCPKRIPRNSELRSAIIAGNPLDVLVKPIGRGNSGKVKRIARKVFRIYF